MIYYLNLYADNLRVLCLYGSKIDHAAAEVACKYISAQGVLKLDIYPDKGVAVVGLEGGGRLGERVVLKPMCMMILKPEHTADDVQKVAASMGLALTDGDDEEGTGEA